MGSGHVAQEVGLGWESRHGSHQHVDSERTDLPMESRTKEAKEKSQGRRKRSPGEEL